MVAARNPPSSHQHLAATVPRLAASSRHPAAAPVLPSPILSAPSAAAVERVTFLPAADQLGVPSTARRTAGCSSWPESFIPLSLGMQHLGGSKSNLRPPPGEAGATDDNLLGLLHQWRDA